MPHTSLTSQVDQLLAALHQGTLDPAHLREALLHLREHIAAPSADHRRLEAVLASISDGLISVDREWRYTYFSDRAAHILGVNPSDMLGRTMWERFPEGRNLRFHEFYHKARDTGLPQHFEEFYPGTLNLWLECHCYPSVEGLTVYFHDITERKNAEAALRDLAEKYQRQGRLFDQIATTTPDFIYVFDLAGRFLYANRRLLEVWGRTFEDAVGKNLYELGYPQWHADMHMREIAQVIATRKPIMGEVPFTGGSGISGVYEYIFTPVLGPDGSVEVIAGTTRDVTARKSAEQAAAEAHRRLDAALFAGEVGTFEWVVSKDLLWGDQNFARIFGIALDPSGGAPLAQYLEAIHPDDRERVLAAVRGTVETGREYEAEYRIVSQGAIRWVIARGTGERDASGRVIRFPGVVLDITARKHAEEALLEAKRAAEHANSAKDHFLAVLSHELRTPLTPVLATAQLLERDKSLTPQHREMVQMILRNTELEARLIDDLLDLTRISRGKLELQISPVDAHEKIRQVVAMCEGDALAKKVSVSTALDAAFHHVPADPARFQQILWNLLKNAVKFTLPGGAISLRSHNSPDCRLLIDVVDTGVGIEPAALPHIFDAFEQGGRDVTRQFGGLGLGLAISKALVELHHGKLTAASPGKNQGATFSLDLPAMTPTPDTAPATSHTVKPALTAAVLLVEDHPDTRRIMTRLLQSLGCTVYAAASVAEALCHREELPLDILISDIGLPDGSGLDIVRTLGERRPIKAIALSGYGMEEDLARSRAAGFHAHLTKPVNLQLLEDTLRRLL